MGKLTAKFVEKAKPGRHADGGGLYLLVKPTGAKSWVLRIVLHGRRRDFGLGSVSFGDPPDGVAGLPLGQRTALSLAEARAKAAEGRRFAKSGLDPSVEWRKARGAVPTFEQAAKIYHEQAKAGWRNGKHGAQWLTSLEDHAFPAIGSVRVDHIEASDIQRVLQPIWLTIPETARRVRQRILAVLDEAHAQKHRETEAPRKAVGELMKKVRQPEKGNFEAMPWQELPAFMRRLRSLPPSVGRKALEFLILTAARSGEVRGCTKAEIRWDDNEWALPKERMKANRPHMVPLVPAAMDIARDMAELAGRDGLLFPGLKGKMMSDATLAKAFKSAGGTGTVHGLRSAFRDWAAEAGFADSWCEAALAHGNPDATEAAYRRTTFFPHRRDRLMPAWAAFLGGESSVVRIAAAR